MPYIKKGELATDKNGVPIKCGDILKDDAGMYHMAKPPWRGDGLEVRDFNAHNVCMCYLGPEGDVVNLGHYSKHPDLVKEHGVEEYVEDCERREKPNASEEERAVR